MAIDALDVDLAAPARSRSSRAARHASWTAPAAIHVIRDADDEPDEPTCAVEPVASTTSSIPSSVRATWRTTSVTPCPTSAAAQWIVALLPSAPSRTRAAQESSNPSE